MAICAIQVEDWPLALQAVRESLRLQPHSSMNRQLLRLVESRIPLGLRETRKVVRMSDEPLPYPDLTGEWIGRYTGHFDEVVRITQTAMRVEAVKSPATSTYRRAK